MTDNDLKATLMAEMEAQIDIMLKAREGGKRLTLTQIEDVVLEARQRLGEKMTEQMVSSQERESVTPTPISPETGKRLQNKGKKNKRSRRV